MAWDTQTDRRTAALLKPPPLWVGHTQVARCRALPTVARQLSWEKVHVTER